MTTTMRTLHPDKTLFSTTWRLPTKDILAAVGIPVPETGRLVINVNSDLLGDSTEITITEIHDGK